MPLSLSLREGSEFAVGDQRFIISQVRAGDDFTLARPDGRSHHINAKFETEILPDVFVIAGERRGGLARITIRAPKEVRISHGYRMTDPP